MSWLYKREKHMIRFFNTKWNSPVSIKWYFNYPHWGIQFRDGYMDVHLGKLAIRVRQQAVPFK